MSIRPNTLLTVGYLIHRQLFVCLFLCCAILQVELYHKVVITFIVSHGGVYVFSSCYSFYEECVTALFCIFTDFIQFYCILV
jgi:hypothetical protein